MADTPPTPKDDSPGIRMAVDYAPLVVFFAVNFLVPSGVAMRIVAGATPFLDGVEKLGAVVIARVILATAAFVAATIAALIVSKIKLGRISPMLWIAGVLVVFFGGLTIYFHDPKFIQMKPTILYAMFAGILAFGLATGKPLLEALLGSAYPGLSALGWRKLTRNWVVFFAFMALLNEVVWRSTSWDFWVGFKLWGALPLTFLFALANVPMLMRHGLTVEEKAVTDIPPEG
ncbi:MAG TPA: inner membrane-spanning protein YciB [Sphingomonas sp.]|nr:inner membrane-spanning protein YciB [Sphingomonas sp.]